MKFLKTILLLSLLISQTEIHAQESAAAYLHVGDRAPEIRVLEWVKGEPVSEFKPGSWYVIEFGATWCAPCRKAIPKLTQLAADYKGRIRVISMMVMEHNENPKGEIPSFVARVHKFVDQQGDKMNYTVGLDAGDKFLEQQWIRAAGKSGIPQAFIINPDGRIAWIGSNTDELIKNVAQFLNQAEVKKVAPPKTTENSLTKLANDVIFQSSLSWYTTEQKKPTFIPYIANFRWEKKGTEFFNRQGTVIAVGLTLRRLYYFAYGDTLDNFPTGRHPVTGMFPDTIKYPHQKSSYGKYWYRPILELSDSSLFERVPKSTKNKFSYHLNMPKEIATAGFMQATMQRDLDSYFGFHVTAEDRWMPCWNLIVSKKNSANKFNLSITQQEYQTEMHANGNNQFKNAIVRDLIFQLEIRYGYGQEGALIHHPNRQPPFFDATGIKDQIDYRLLAADLEALTIANNEGTDFPFEEYRKILKGWGFELVKSQRRMKVVVVRDKPN